MEHPLFYAALLGALAILPSEAAQPWDTAFDADTQRMVEAASHIVSPGHPEITLFLEDYHYAIHADGRTVATIRKVYRVEQQDAVEEWSFIEQPFQPWYQDVPEVHARVIGKGGTERRLDPKTVANAPARQFDATIFSDERVIRAPLPGVEPGSIVEIEIVLSDKAPLLDAGVAQRINVPNQLPVERFHVLIEAEPGANLQTSSKLIPESALRQSTTEKGTRVELELGPIAAQTDFEWNLPFDVPSAPYLGFSTGRSWQAVAARYDGIVEQQIQNADLKNLLNGVDLTGAPLQVAARLAALLHKNVRYTGVEFGESAIVPMRPEETLRRGYGDCKDKAALLVAMLRAAGLKTNVALLDSGMGPDVDAGLPGMGVFDHAIVHVDSTPPLWIDATASDTRIGFLPPGDEGRLALIASRTTTALTKIPESDSQQTWEHQNIDVQMSGLGPGTYEATFEVSGASLEGAARTAFGGEKNKSPEQLEQLVKQGFSAKSLGKVQTMPRDDMSGPFRMTVEALGVKAALTGMEDAAVALTPWVLFQNLPYALTRPANEDSTGDKPRAHDFIINAPYQMEVRYVIHPPAPFKATKLPASGDVAMGTAAFSRHFEEKPDGSVEVIYRFDSGKRRLTAAEFTEFRAALKERVPRSPDLITFVPETAELIALGQTSKAISLLREQIGAHPQDVNLHIRFSNVLLSAGLGDAALEEAQKAELLDPKSATAWMNLGMALQYDTFGRLRRGDWNFEEAEKALRKAADLDADNELSRTNLAILLEHNPQGWRYAADARTDEAIAIYRELAKKPQHQPMIDQNLAVLLVRNRRFDEARQQLSNISGEGPATLSDTITAMEQSAAQSIIKAQAAYPDARQRAIHLASVSQTLAQFREYAAASALMNAAARLINVPDVQTRAELLSKVKHWQEAIVAETDPRWPMQRLIVEAFQGTLTAESFKRLASSRLLNELKPEDLLTIQSGVAGARQRLSAAGVEDEVLLDLVLSLMELEKVGDDEHGYRIKAMAPGAPQTLATYVAPEGNGFKFIGVPSTGLEAIGELILELLDKSDVKGAQWWLDRVSKDVEPRADGTGSPAVKGLWSGVTEESRGPAAIRVAAAAITGSSKGSPKALSILEAARLKAPNQTERSQIDKAICETLLAARKWDEMMVAARRLEDSKLFSMEGFEYFIKAATNAGKWKELEVEAQKKLGSGQTSQIVGSAGSRVVVRPARIQGTGDLVAIKAIVLAKWKQGDSAGVTEWIKKISSSDLAGTDERVYAAWVAMGQGHANQAALDQLKAGKDRAGSDKAYAFAVSMMQAVLGASDDSSQGLAKATNGVDIVLMPAVAWAIHGKLCQQYQLRTCARNSLERAVQATAATKNDESTQWLLVVLGR